MNEPADRMADLKKRVEQFNALELPGQPMGMHMGTMYLVGDLMREIERLSSAPAKDDDGSLPKTAAPRVQNGDGKVAIGSDVVERAKQMLDGADSVSYPSLHSARRIRAMLQETVNEIARLKGGQ